MTGQEATTGCPPNEMALSLMKSALQLLDASGEDLAAIHLQHAISIVEGEPMSSVDDDGGSAAD